MKLTELDRLNRDLVELIETRRGLDGILKRLAIGRTVTTTWIRYRIQRMICDVDYRIGLKKKDIHDAEIRKRLGEGEKKDDISELERELDEVYDGEADPGKDPGADRRAEDHVQQGHERAGGYGRGRNELGGYGAVREIPQEEAAGAESAEACLRARYRERHEGALREWQREIMEADRAGKHERLTL